MSALTAPQRPVMGTTETRNAAVSFLDLLDSGELLTGTPTVVEITTTDLTIGSKAVNSASVTINGVSHAAGQAVQFSVTGGNAGTTYRIRITCSTDAGQTLEGQVLVLFSST